RVTIVVVEDVQTAPQPRGQTANEAELAVVSALANPVWYRLGERERSGVEHPAAGPQLNALVVAAGDGDAVRLRQLQLQVDDVARHQPVDCQQPIARLYAESLDRRAWLDGLHDQPGRYL